MGQFNQPSTTLADLNTINQKVTTRTISWLDMAQRAWGGEFKAPDHSIYRFSNGREFDSTDKSYQGFYGTKEDSTLQLDGPRYPDMFNGALLAEDGTRLILTQQV